MHQQGSDKTWTQFWTGFWTRLDWTGSIMHWQLLYSGSDVAMLRQRLSFPPSPFGIALFDKMCCEAFSELLCRDSTALHRESRAVGYCAGPTLRIKGSGLLCRPHQESRAVGYCAGPTSRIKGSGLLCRPHIKNQG